MTNPMNVGEYVKGIVFSTSPEDIINLAEENGIAEEILRVFKIFDGKKYKESKNISQKMEKKTTKILNLSANKDS